MGSPLNPGELLDAPELAVIAILERALEVAELSLRSAHPGGCDPAELPPREREPAAHSLGLLYQIAPLRSLLREYTASVHRARAANPPGSGSDEREF